MDVDALIYTGFKALASLYHLELVVIPVGSSGLDLTALRLICELRRIRAVYTMPTMHNPLGWVIIYVQHTELALIARTFDLLVIEDAAYAFLLRRPPPPLASYASERTVYVSGFTKSIATGLRVVAIVCPAEMRIALDRAIRATFWIPPLSWFRLSAAGLKIAHVKTL